MILKERLSIRDPTCIWKTHCVLVELNVKIKVRFVVEIKCSFWIDLSPSIIL